VAGENQKPERIEPKLRTNQNQQRGKGETQQQSRELPYHGAMLAPGDRHAIACTDEGAGTPSVIESRDKLASQRRVELTAGIAMFPHSVCVVLKGIPDHAFKLDGGPLIGIEANRIASQPGDPHDRVLQKRPHLIPWLEPARQGRTQQTLLPREIGPSTLGRRRKVDKLIQQGFCIVPCMDCL
jgi:hypothetical protein